MWKVGFLILLVLSGTLTGIIAGGWIADVAYNPGPVQDSGSHMTRGLAALAAALDGRGRQMAIRDGRFWGGIIGFAAGGIGAGLAVVVGSRTRNKREEKGTA